MSTATTSASATPGLLIAGKYRLLHPVGEGAMGSVWAARNEVTSAEVALKLIHQPDPEMRQRMQREARVGALLKHRHVLDVYDAGEAESGDPFLVMQLLQGETLAALLRRKRRLDAPEAARIARDVARALSAAHTRQIVHRDLKPANIFLHQEPGEDEPVVKVLDFGVAKDLTSSDSLRTVTGTVIGSLFYMSPEQASAQADVDPRADLWSLGVVLFEMLTGRRPFQGDPPHVLSALLLGDIPRPSSYVRRLDEGLDDIVSRCMRRDRKERPASAAELVKQLHRFAEPAPHAAAASRVEPAPAPGITQTLVLSESSPAVGPRGTMRMDRPGAAMASPDAAGRKSIEPVVAPVPVVERASTPPAPVPSSDTPSTTPSSARPRRRRSRLAVLIPLLLLGAGGAVAAKLVLPGREMQSPAAQQPAVPAESAGAPAPASASAPASTPAPAPESAPASALTPAPESESAPASASASASAPVPVPALGGPWPKEEDPCEDKAGIILLQCRKNQQRRNAEEAYGPEEDDTYE